MNFEERKEYVKYRIESSHKTFDAAKVLAENEFWNSAVNRLYYSLFYAVNALLVMNEIQTKSHSATNKHSSNLKRMSVEMPNAPYSNRFQLHVINMKIKTLKVMKKLFLFLLFLSGSNFGYAQHFDFGLGVGTGSAYLFENSDASVDINYSLPFNGYVRVQYIPAASFFNLNLNFQYINTGISGRNWKNDKTINGEVSSLTTSFLLEHLKNNKTWNFGYAFGPGYTVENYSENPLYERQEEVHRFMSLTASGIASVAVSKVLRVRMESTVLSDFLTLLPLNIR